MKRSGTQSVQSMEWGQERKHSTTTSPLYLTRMSKQLEIYTLHVHNCRFVRCLQFYSHAVTLRKSGVRRTQGYALSSSYTHTRVFTTANPSAWKNADVVRYMLSLCVRDEQVMTLGVEEVRVP